MSRYMGIFCADCAQFTGARANHGRETLLDIIALAPAIKRLEEADTHQVLEVEMAIPTGYDWSVPPVIFVREHYGHAMRLYDEYGYIYNEQGEQSGTLQDIAAATSDAEQHHDEQE